jgi:hypothetical protein
LFHYDFSLQISVFSVHSGIDYTSAAFKDNDFSATTAGSGHRAKTPEFSLFVGHQGLE